MPNQCRESNKIQSQEKKKKAFTDIQVYKILCNENQNVNKKLYIIYLQYMVLCKITVSSEVNFNFIIKHHIFGSYMLYKE